MPKTDFIKDVVARKKERILAAKAALPEEELKNRIQGMPPCRKFKEAISKPRTISLIAEIKKASPSAGVLRENFSLEEICAAYKEAGVQAVSVLTEEDYFLGDISYLARVKSLIDAPVLRKDFLLEPYQVYESRAFGADAILLIADLLTRERIIEMTQLAGELGLASLIEVHTEKELKKTLNLKADLIGLNNRDLHTFEVDLKTTEKLYMLTPKDKTVVVESGLRSRQDVMFLKILGINAVLIGEAFMRSADIKRSIEEIMGW
ncbi:MAG: indole-3-glycerol phosphate synthase TrpC [Candidatus Omnitrophica bacterium]|nr:indole-3-glycerol phosphate synthase TrpC [Candidatus Omnitrophota bacterium]